MHFKVGCTLFGWEKTVQLILNKHICEALQSLFAMERKIILIKHNKICWDV